MAKRSNKIPNPGRAGYSKEFKEELFSKVLDLIAEKGLPVYKALKECGTSFNPFSEWLTEKKENNERYARACEIRAEYLESQMIDIADDSSNDIKVDNNGQEIINSENIQRSKLRVETRKWLMGKLKPKKYGDKIDITTDEKPIQPVLNIVFDGKEAKKID